MEQSVSACGNVDIQDSCSDQEQFYGNGAVGIFDLLLCARSDYKVGKCWRCMCLARGGILLDQEVVERCF